MNVHNFMESVLLTMADGDWKRACKAGAITPEDAANPAYRDGFLTGVYAVIYATSRMKPKGSEQLLRSAPFGERSRPFSKGCENDTSQIQFHAR
jgi:hypothetical protein